MQTLTLKARSGKDSMIRLEIPTDTADQEVEIVLVMQPTDDEPVDAMGYPIGYFEETYACLPIILWSATSRFTLMYANHLNEILPGYQHLYPLYQWTLRVHPSQAAEHSRS